MAYLRRVSSFLKEANMKKEDKINYCSVEKGEIFPVALLNQKMPKKEKQSQIDFTHLRRRHCTNH